MREYIHLFENSDLRDAYENGSDYIEPYVSYTPVINEYKAQLNGETRSQLAVTKQGNSYLISSNSSSIEIINEEEFEEPPIVNSNVFYISSVSVINNGTKKTRAHMYVFPEDLELTEESTEFTFNGVTYAIESIGTNAWSVNGRNPDEGLHFSNMYKFDIVSVPSSTSTDFVHYNKLTPERITAKFIVVSDYATKDQATLSRKITGDSRLLEQIYINGTPILGLLIDESPKKITVDYSVYHTFEEEGTYDIEYVLKEEYAGTIPNGLFPDHQYFSKIIIPKGVTTIKAGAFSFISNYPYTNPEINVIIPNTIIQVEDDAVGCSYLNSSTIQKFISINPNSIYTGACEK